MKNGNLMADWVVQKYFFLRLQNLKLDCFQIQLGQGIDEHVSRKNNVELTEPYHLRFVLVHCVLDYFSIFPFKYSPIKRDFIL